MSNLTPVPIKRQFKPLVPYLFSLRNTHQSIVNKLTPVTTAVVAGTKTSVTLTNKNTNVSVTLTYPRLTLGKVLDTIGFKQETFYLSQLDEIKASMPDGLTVGTMKYGTRDVITVSNNGTKNNTTLALLHGVAAIMLKETPIVVEDTEPDVDLFSVISTDENKRVITMDDTDILEEIK